MTLARELGLIPGNAPTGPRNSITDVPGVLVGHQTILRENLATGVTAILPHGGNLYLEKVSAALDVINGYGKSTGLMQIDELGSIETPILLTNTFGVGTCSNALIRRAIKENPEIARTTSTVNPVVCECNDGYLSDIQALAVTEDDANQAILAACDHKVEQGSVGAGTGIRCFGFKGGIGTSSRVVELGDKSHTLGILVQTNFGGAGGLRLPDGRRPNPTDTAEPDKGSVIIILATDIPLENRQLKRITKRCGAGLARLGSVWGHGSGDIAVGFTTAHKIHHDEKEFFSPLQRLAEDKIDSLFFAVADCVTEAVLNSLTMATPVRGRNGHTAPIFMDWYKKNLK